ncbi:MAG: hypothetical protein ABW138_08090, partial [Candidatus Thiodiazotropha sp. 4PDIVS1]
SAAMLGKTGRPETRCAQTVRPADRFFLRFSHVSKRDIKRRGVRVLSYCLWSWVAAPHRKPYCVVGCGLPHHRGVDFRRNPDTLFTISSICNPNFQVISLQLGMVRQTAPYT